MADQTPDAVAEGQAQEPVEVSTDAASTNFYWTFGTKEVFNLQTTIRGILTVEQIHAHLQSVIHGALMDVVHMGGHAKQVGRYEPTERAVISTGPLSPTIAVAAPDPASPAAPATAAPAGPTSPQQGKKVNTLIVTVLEITPRSDGRVDLKFVGSGHQRPDIIKTAAPENAVGMLAPTGAWTLEHMALAGKYNVKMAVEWVESEKLNSKGNPYRDIVAVKPA